MKKLFLLMMAVVLVGCGKTETCHWCKEPIKEAALICKHCGLNPKELAAEVPVKPTKFTPQMVVAAFEKAFDRISEEAAKEKDTRPPRLPAELKDPTKLAEMTEEFNAELANGKMELREISVDALANWIISAEKPPALCPFCKKHFPHAHIMGHKLSCPKNPNDGGLTAKVRVVDKKPTIKSMLAIVSQPLTKDEESFAGRRKVEQRGGPDEPITHAEAIYRKDHTTSIVFLNPAYDDNGKLIQGKFDPALAHGIWQIKGDRLYFLDLVYDDESEPEESQMVIEAILIKALKNNFVYKIPESKDEEGEINPEQIFNEESIKKFEYPEMRAYNSADALESFDLLRAYKHGLGAALREKIQSKGLRALKDLYRKTKRFDPFDFGPKPAVAMVLCPFCKKHFAGHDILTHKLLCPKNDTDITLQGAEPTHKKK